MTTHTYIILLTKKKKRMAVFETITELIKDAMRSKDKVRLEALRAVKKELLEASTAKGAGGNVSEDQELKIFQKMVKQRKESAELYAQQGREDLAAPELAEATIIESFLPKQMSEAEIGEALKEIVAKLGATGPQDMGKVMGAAMKALAGKADGKLISKIVKEILNQ